MEFVVGTASLEFRPTEVVLTSSSILDSVVCHYRSNMENIHGDSLWWVQQVLSLGQPRLSLQVVASWTQLFVTVHELQKTAHSQAYQCKICELCASHANATPIV